MRLGISISLRKCLSVLSSWTKIHPILPGVVNFYVYTVLPSRSTIHPLPGVVHFQLLFQLPSISMRGWDQWEMGASKSPPSFGTLTKSRQASARAIFHKYNGTKRCVRTHVWWDGVSQVPRACTVVSGSLTKLFKRDEEEKWHIDT